MNFYLTFGQKYHYESHPTVCIKPINPDGYVKIVASDYQKAREKAFEVFGTFWSFLYDEKDFKFKFFPRGELFTIVE
jgi:hypothetical protein